MKYKKNKIASEMQVFYFLVKFGLVRIYMLKFYSKKSFSILLREIRSIHHYLHFSFEKYVLSQVLNDISVVNLETTPSTFLSKSSEIYLSRIIN